MALAGLRVQDKLDVASKFGIWKSKILLLLEEHGIKDYAMTNVAVTSNPKLLVDYHKADAKDSHIIQDGVKDLIIPHIAGFDTCKKMWDVILKLFQSATVNKKLILREKLRNIKQNKGEGVVSYLTRVRQVKDELVAFGEKIDDDELMRIALQGFSKQWGIFVQAINGQHDLAN